MRWFFELRLRLFAWRRFGLIKSPPVEMRVLGVLATTNDELDAIDIWRALGGFPLWRPTLASILSALRHLESLGTVVCREQYDSPAQPEELRYLWSDAVTSGRSERWRRPRRRRDMALS
jgi:hypothetical protein